jgi:hypothetical protein
MPGTGVSVDVAPLMVAPNETFVRIVALSAAGEFEDAGKFEGRYSGMARSSRISILASVKLSVVIFTSTPSL